MVWELDWRRGMDDELPWDGDTMRRAKATDDPAAFPTVVLSVPEAEFGAADGAIGYFGVRLPPRKYNLSTPTRVPTRRARTPLD